MSIVTRSRVAVVGGLVAACGSVFCGTAMAQQTPPSKPDVKQIGDDAKKHAQQAGEDAKKKAMEGGQKKADDAKKAAENAAGMGGMDPKMMEAMEKAATPGPEHAKMAEHEGNWTVKGQWWMAEGAPAMPMTGTAKFSMIMGGRMLKQEFHSSDNGMEMEGMGFVTYNNTAKRYESTWTDNMGTGMMWMTGKAGADGTVTTTGDCADPISGQMKKYKFIEKASKDTMHFEMWEITSDGKEWKNMDMDYVRAANSGLEIKTIDIKPVQAKPAAEKK